MAQMRIFLVCVAALALYSSSSTAKEIEVCVIPLRDIVKPEARMFVGSLQHLFVRGADGTGLNFEPERPMEFLDGKARIGRQNYPAATCKRIFTTDNDAEYYNAWNAIVQAYEDEAATNRYSVATMNCQMVTRKVLGNLGYTIPSAIECALDNQQACSVQ